MTRGRGVTALLCLIALVLALHGTAQAEDAEAGRRFFKRGQDLLKANDYRGALKAFEAGFAAAPRVGFLLNIGNCYRKLGELGKAREHYWKFLDAAPKDHPSRPSVNDYLRAMEQIEADGVSVDSAPAKGPPPAPEPATAPGPPPQLPPTLSAPPPPDAPSPGLVLVDSPARDQKAPVYKRWWFWTLVGGAVAAGVGTYVLTRRAATPHCSASLGCFSEP
jgi:tetratricopeptide (TPR) repeat protein